MQGNSLISEFMGINFNADENKNRKERISALETEEKGINIKIKEKEKEQVQFYNKHKKQDATLSKALNELNKNKEKIRNEIKKIKKEIEKKAQESTGVSELLKNFQQKKDEFLNESNVSQKTKLKEEIDNLLVEIFETRLRAQRADFFNRLKNIENKYSVLPNEKQRNEKIKQEKQKLYKDSDFNLETAEKQLKEFTSGRQIKPFFLWNLYFSEVFHNKGGFDVVIGNPPYVGQSGNKEIFREVLTTSFGKRYHQRRMDYFYFFIHRAIELAQNTTGVISFITTNYFFNATYADKLRIHIFDNCRFQKLINFNESKIFENATGQHSAISVMIKNANFVGSVATLKTNRKGLISNDTIKSILAGSDTETAYYKYHCQDVFDGPKHYIRTEGRFTTENMLNRPFDSILSRLQNSNFTLNQVAEIFQGIVTGANFLSQKAKVKYNINKVKGSGIFIVSDSELNKMTLSKTENSFIKPWYKNSDIRRWLCSNFTDRHIIYLTSIDDVKDKQIPHLINHFKVYKSLLINRNVRTGNVTLEVYDSFTNGAIDIPYVMIKSTFRSGRYFCVSYAREKFIFESPKIVCPQRSPINTFGYSEQEWYAASDVYYILKKENSKFNLKYLLSLLNSKLYYFWLYYKGQRKGQTLQLFKDPLSEIPIKEILPESQQPYINLVDRILTITKSEDYLQNPQKQARVKKLEREIDQMVYQLYDLTEEEIRIVEGEEK